MAEPNIADNQALDLQSASALIDQLQEEAEKSENQEVEDQAEEEVLEETQEDFEDSEDDAEPLDEDDEEEVEQEAALYTVKVNGEDKQVTLDEALNGYSRQADYTRKSQELAASKKDFEDEREAVLQERATYASLLPQLQNALMVDDEPEPDWDKEFADNPMQASRLKYEWDKKRDLKYQKLQAIQNEQQRLQSDLYEEQNRAIEELRVEETSKLPDLIPEWKDNSTFSKEKGEIKEYLMNEGITEEEIMALTMAKHIQLIRKAWLYDKGVAKTKKTRAQTGKTVSSGSSQKTPVKKSKATRNAQERLQSSGRLDDAVDLAKLLEL